jgi:hypothetical protein
MPAITVFPVHLPEPLEQKLRELTADNGLTYDEAASEVLESLAAVPVQWPERATLPTPQEDPPAKPPPASPPSLGQQGVDFGKRAWDAIADVPVLGRLIPKAPAPLRSASPPVAPQPPPTPPPASPPALLGTLKVPVSWRVNRWLPEVSSAVGLSVAELSASLLLKVKAHPKLFAGSRQAQADLCLTLPAEPLCQPEIVAEAIRRGRERREAAKGQGSSLGPARAQGP